MWTLKSVTITPEAGSTAFSAAITFQAQGKSDVNLTTRLSSRAELEATIRQNIARLDERSALITETSGGTFQLTPPPTPVPETAKQKAQREYDEALVLYNDLKTKAELDSATFAWGRDNQRVIVQQKLQALMALG